METMNKEIKIANGMARSNDRVIYHDETDGVTKKDRNL